MTKSNLNFKINKNDFLHKLENLYSPEIVSIDDEKIKKLNFSSFSTLDTLEPLPPAIDTALEAIIYSLLVNSLNYQFWDLRDNQFIRYSNNNKTGALAMFDGFNKLYAEFDYNYVIRQNKNKDFFSKEENLTKLKEFFGPLPDMDSRVAILNEMFDPYLLNIANVLLKNAALHASWTVNEANFIAEVFPTAYKDNFLKKAQLSLILASSYLKNFNLPLKNDFTVCADYQLPKVLEHLGILKYSPSLKNKIDNFVEIAPGSDAENALRAATVIACDKICKTHSITSEALDYWLWLKRNEPKTNFHLTKTTCY